MLRHLRSQASAQVIACTRGYVGNAIGPCMQVRSCDREFRLCLIAKQALTRSMSGRMTCGSSRISHLSALESVRIKVSPSMSNTDAALCDAGVRCEAAVYCQAESRPFRLTHLGKCLPWPPYLRPAPSRHPWQMQSCVGRAHPHPRQSPQLGWWLPPQPPALLPPLPPAPPAGPLRLPRQTKASHTHHACPAAVLRRHQSCCLQLFVRLPLLQAGPADPEGGRAAGFAAQHGLCAAHAPRRNGCLLTTLLQAAVPRILFVTASQEALAAPAGVHRWAQLMEVGALQRQLMLVHARLQESAVC